MDFISMRTELPPSNVLVSIKRIDGRIWVGYRSDQPLSVNPDPSRECHWWANHASEAFNIESGKLNFNNNFSDVTVEGWAHMHISGIPPVTSDQWTKEYQGMTGED